MAAFEVRRAMPPKPWSAQSGGADRCRARGDSVGTDLYSLQGLRNVGPTLRRWRAEWRERHDRYPVVDISIPDGTMSPAGYVVMQHAVRLDRPVQAYQKWVKTGRTVTKNSRTLKFTNHGFESE